MKNLAPLNIAEIYTEYVNLCLCTEIWNIITSALPSANLYNEGALIHRSPSSPTLCFLCRKAP